MPSFPILVDQDFGSAARVLNLLDPASAQEPATRAYVDAVAAGLDWKDNVRVAAPGNVNISAPGASIDGVTLSVNDRVLIPNNTSQPENGIYIFNGSATSLTRATDASTMAALKSAVVVVDEGTSAGSVYRQTTLTGTVGSANIVWASFFPAAPSASTSVAGVVQLADQTTADTGTDTTKAATVSVIKNASWRVRKSVPTTIGDGSATSFNLDHNFATRDVIVEVYKNSGSYDKVEVGVTRPTTNRVTLSFATAPALNAYSVVVIG